MNFCDGRDGVGNDDKGGVRDRRRDGDKDVRDGASDSIGSGDCSGAGDRRGNVVGDGGGNVVGDGDGDAGSVFARAMHGVRRLEFQEHVSHRRPRPATAKMARAARQEMLRESLQGPADGPDDIESCGEGVCLQRPCVSKRTFRRLRQGRIPIQDEADLHGLTAARARTCLREFIADSVTCGHKCVRVIHGKGLRSGSRGAVLRTETPRWLARCDDVLAFVSARPCDGGSGALYVLLKRRQ